jgi:hypothetical protein
VTEAEEEAEEKETLLAELAAMPGFVAGRIGSLPVELERREGPDGAFSPVEQCWHLADLEVEGFGVRIRRLLSEERPWLADFPGARLARERHYREKSLAQGLQVFRAAREANVALLRTVPAATWRRDGVQEGVGPVTLADIPRMMRDHDASHRAEIMAWLQAR